MDVAFYEENIFLYAVASSGADEAIFLLREGGDVPSPFWEALVPGSPRWDAVHQGIFRNHRARRLSPAAVPGDLPPLPPVPQGPFPPWQSYFAPAEPIEAAQFPHVARLLSCPAGVEIAAVLHEDVWESSFGDGLFLYLVHTCLSWEEARAFAEAHTAQYDRYVIKPMQLKLSGDHITFPNFSLDAYEHCKQEDVLRLLEERLRTAG